MPEGREEQPMRPPPDPHTDRSLVVFLTFGLVLGLVTGTDYVAWRFAFHPSLGAPLVVFKAHTARLLRGACVLAVGTALSSTLFPRVRGLLAPLVLAAVCTGLGSLGPVYAPYRIFEWHAAYAAVPSVAQVFRVAWAVVVTVAIAPS